MKITRKQLYAAGAAIAAVGIVWWLTHRKNAAGPPAVAGTVTSGGQSLLIDDNVLSPGFGLPFQ